MSQSEHISMKRSQLQTSRYDDVARAFGSLARGYDETFDPNRVIQRLREDLYQTVERLVPPPAHVLDINCGTGTDALYLASRGYSTVGIDITEQMISEARRKSAGNANARFVHTSYDDMDTLPESTFDLVVSNFGGLNCTPNLRTVAEHVSVRLKPGGIFVAVLMPPFSIWETCAYLVRGRFRQAFRRLQRRGTQTEFYGQPFTVYYFNPKEAERQLGEHFTVRDMYAWNIFTPPPHAWRVAEIFPRLTVGLESLDRMLCRLPIFRAIGDHYVIILQKRVQ